MPVARWSLIVAAGTDVDLRVDVHVGVMQVERRRSDRMRGIEVKLCRGGGQEVAHSSEAP